MSEPTLDEVMARLDELLKEVRRQGRAAVAAQAAAESCLEAIEQGRRDAEDEVEDEVEEEAEALAGLSLARDNLAGRWLEALIPVADAIDRIAEQASSLAAHRPEPRRSLLARLVKAPPEDDGGRALRSLAEGLRVLKAQLESALGDLGVTVDRRVGAPVDAERQRVVEVRSPRAGERPGQVVEVVRAGFALGPFVVREAEVVVTAGEPEVSR